MRSRSRFSTALLSAAIVLATTAVGADARPSTPGPASAQTATLVAIRAAQHPTYDRVVFEFTGAVPTRHEARYVPQLVEDGSGQIVPVAGAAILEVVMFPADGHDQQGTVTYGPRRRAFALKNVMQVVNAGDFEATLTFGVGLAAPTPFRVFTLSGPSRVVIDIDTPFATVPVRDYFLDQDRFEANTPPFTTAVSRQVIPPAVASGALHRLFAGPTQGELASRLRFQSSGATGFTGLSIQNGVARVRLVGDCSSGGSTFTVADEIFATLKQFSTVRWVKILDPAGNTERPTGQSDSIPECLEP